MNNLASHRILIVDDDESLLRLLAIRLQSKGYCVEAVSDGKTALGKLATFLPQLIITDLRMNGMDGMTLFKQIHEKQPSLPVIILTAHGNIPDAVSATHQGVYGYLTKPFDSRILLQNIESALRITHDQHEVTHAATEDAWREDIICRSQVMEELLNRAKMVAASEASIFIQSKSGTGKELLAKAIHKASNRSNGPFIAINCAAIPEQLFESELFGHSKGAFTGAIQNHRGLFQAADDGTLFLDEIGDMPLAFQVKLLRVLQEGEIRPVGSTRSVPVDVRIISATNSDLASMVENGAFREDLYYRLNVVMLELPPLSDRREDIPMLANYLLKNAANQSGKTVTGFSPEAMEILVAAPWPGNVRQLLNVTEQTMVLSQTPVISATLVNKALNNSKSTEMLSFADARDRFERDYLVMTLQATDGNVSQAARLAQRNRSEFYKLLRRHKLEPELFRTRAS